MALTNDQITAQNFKDFYGQIRPYLNGQVPTFANQFSRSDLYSTDEKIIGSFTDGKPLYQKTVTGNTSSSAGWETHDLGIGANVIDKVVSLDGVLYSTSGWHVGMGSGEANNELKFEVKPSTDKWEVYTGNIASHNNVPCVLTIRYTKTTDSAIKVGTGTDYSTEEQVIGTWIDGKPLYQKTFETTTPANNTDTLIVELPSNCIARSFDGYILQSGYNHIPLNAYYSSAEFVCTYMQFNPDNGIRMKCENTQWRSSTAVITVRYTKTTD